MHRGGGRGSNAIVQRHNCRWLMLRALLSAAARRGGSPASHGMGAGMQLLLIVREVSIVHEAERSSRVVIIGYRRKEKAGPR